MANLITLARLILLFVVVAIAYQPSSTFQLINLPLLIALFVADAIDGHVARRLNESSVFGAMFDIASDRIVEYTLWIIFADLDLVPIWVPLIFVFRGTIVDTIRSSHVRAEGEVVWRQFHGDTPGHKGALFTVGIRFLSLGEPSRKAVHDYVRISNAP